MRDGSTAAAPPSTSFPAGLSAGGRVRSLIHVSLLIVFTRRWRAPTFVNRCFWPDSRTVPVWPASRLDTSLKSNQLRPSGARNIRREDRQHGKCGDWRTSLSYLALGLKRKRKSCLCLGCNLLVTRRIIFWPRRGATYSLSAILLFAVDFRLPVRIHFIFLRIYHRGPSFLSKGGEKTVFPRRLFGKLAVPLKSRKTIPVG